MSSANNNNERRGTGNESEEDGSSPPIQIPPIEAFQSRIRLSGSSSSDSDSADDHHVNNRTTGTTSTNLGPQPATTELDHGKVDNDIHGLDSEHEHVKNNYIDIKESEQQEELIDGNQDMDGKENDGDKNDFNDTKNSLSDVDTPNERSNNNDKRFMEEVKNVDELVSKYFPDDEDDNNNDTKTIKDTTQDFNNDRFSRKKKNGYDQLATTNSSHTNEEFNNANEDDTTTMHGGRSTRVQTVMITAGEGIKEILYRANEATRAAFHVNHTDHNNSNNKKSYHPYLTVEGSGIRTKNADDDDDDITEVTANLSPKKPNSMMKTTSARLRDALQDVSSDDGDDDDDLDFDSHYELALPSFDNDDSKSFEDNGSGGGNSLKTQKSGESSDEQIHATISSSNVIANKGDEEKGNAGLAKATAARLPDDAEETSSTSSCYFFNTNKGTTTIKSKLLGVVDEWLEQRGQRGKPTRKARRGSASRQSSTFDRKRKVVHDLSKYGQYKTARSFDSSDDIDPDDMGGEGNFFSSLYRRNKRVTRATTLAAAVTLMMVIAIGAFVYQTKENELYHTSSSFSSNSSPETDAQVADDDRPPLIVDSSNTFNPIHDHISDAFAPQNPEDTNIKDGDDNEEGNDDPSMLSLMHLLETYTTMNVLMDPTTPQYRARMSMGIDEIDISQTTSQDEIQMLISRSLERYALLTMFYALGGRDADMVGTPTMMVGASAAVSSVSSSRKSQWKNASGWASTHHTDMCLWYGITCHPTHMRVQHISLRDNGLTGTIPPEVGIFEMLETLDLTSNYIEGGIPQDIGNIRSLRTIRLGNNNLVVSSPTSHIFEPFTNNNALEELELNDNHFKGTLIPPTINGQIKNDVFTPLSNLRILSLANNGLNGSIPKEIGLLTSLTECNLSGNSFSSSLPPTMGDLINLFELDLGQNSFEGELPSELMELQDLHVLRLNNNQFGGPIPSYVLHELVSLEELDLSHNNFEGALNGDLGLLTSLETLKLEGNALLTGTMPSSICDLHPPRGELVTLTVDCNRVECFCCACIP